VNVGHDTDVERMAFEVAEYVGHDVGTCVWDSEIDRVGAFAFKDFVEFGEPAQDRAIAAGCVEAGVFVVRDEVGYLDAGPGVTFEGSAADLA